MTEHDPAELVQYCRRLLSAGEITNVDLYELAEWLNAHKEACFHWPGDKLSCVLQEVWADGEVRAAELRKVCRLLVQIQKEWRKQQDEQAFEIGADLAEEAVRSFDPGVAILPRVPIQVRIKSHSEKGLYYDVDLAGPSCACPDWLSYRQNHPEGNIGRCCKHILDAYGEIEPMEGWPAWFGALLETGYAPHPLKKWFVLSLGKRFVLISSAHGGWADVFAAEEGEYQRFGYNLSEDRWAYGIEPRESRRIKTVIFDAC